MDWLQKLVWKKVAQDAGKNHIDEIGFGRGFKTAGDLFRYFFIGLEMLVIKINVTVLVIGGLSIITVLMARWAAVFFPILLLRYKIKFEKHAVAILTWGGLRGGLSVALALSLSPQMHRDEFVLVTYMIVIFSILVQGLTIGGFAKKLQKPPVAN